MKSHPLPNLTVQQLEYLVAAVDSPTHAEAAASVGVSPSALSQGLTELGRRVGLTLFEREGRRQVVRPQAVPVLDHARRVLASTADLERYVEATRGGRAGQIRIGMIDAAAIDHFGSVLRNIRGDRPDLEFHLTVGPSGGLFSDLEQGRLDLVVGVVPDREMDTVKWVELTVEPLHIYAPSTSRSGHGGDDPGRWGPWVTFPEGSHTRNVIARALRQMGVSFDVVAVSHQPEVLREMVSLGLGWTVLPPVQAEREPGALSPVSTKPLATRTLVAAWRESGMLPAAAVVVREALVHYASTELQSVQPGISLPRSSGFRRHR